MTMEEAMSAYYESYKPKEVKDLEQKGDVKNMFLWSCFIIAAAAYLYRK